MGTCRYCAISSASGRFALPVRSFSSYAIVASFLFVWLGREDSNLRIRDLKSRALPLGHAPSCSLPRTQPRDDLRSRTAVHMHASVGGAPAPRRPVAAHCCLYARLGRWGPSPTTTC